ncbi:MAG: hypothetical protein KKF89_06105 [Nanoarchaeota archaeon]|nr:hypothetical protein [Nanoarchaeota archaeon]MBU1855272.1 hypothetical protein [Nanoarchaeota archaeon]
MDLDKFLEKDIIEFLELKDKEREERKDEASEEIVEKISTHQTQYQLFQDAIERKDFYSAEKMFEDVKNKFARATSESEKNKYMTLMENMYTDLQNSDFENFEKKEDVEKEFVNEIKSLEKDDKLIHGKKRIEQEKELKEQKIKIKNEISECQEKIIDYLQREDLEAAIKEYKKMKARFDMYPEEPKEEKQEVFTTVISTYYQLRKLETLKRSRTENKKKQEEDKRKTLLSETKQEVMLSTKKINIYLGDKQLKNSMSEYNKLKDLFETFPRNLKEERKALYEITLKIYKQIHEKTEEIKRTTITKEKEGKEKEVPKEKEHLDFIMELKKDVREIIFLMKDQKIKEAENNLLDIRRRMTGFPPNKAIEKAMFEHLIKEITHRLNFLKQTLEVKNA